MPKVSTDDFARLQDAFNTVCKKNPPRKYVSLQLSQKKKLTYNQLLENYFHFCAAVDTGLDVDFYRKYNDYDIQTAMKQLVSWDDMAGE